MHPADGSGVKKAGNIAIAASVNSTRNTFSRLQVHFRLTAGGGCSAWSRSERPCRQEPCWATATCSVQRAPSHQRSPQSPAGSAYQPGGTPLPFSVLAPQSCRLGCPWPAPSTAPLTDPAASYCEPDVEHLGAGWAPDLGRTAVLSAVLVGSRRAQVEGEKAPIYGSWASA
jgi:hypothetical protein